MERLFLLIKIFCHYLKERIIVFCFEPKLVTSQKTIYDAIKKLKERGIHDVYFDSFFSNKLDFVNDANQELETDYQRSLHLCGNLGRFKLRVPLGSGDYDLLTVPNQVSIGDLKEPVIYGAVGSVEKLQELSLNPDCMGAYVRLKEGKGIKGSLRMFYTSLTNNQSSRAYKQ